MTGQDLRKLYHEDLFVWAFRNAQLLREGRFAEADMENIAEEIESLGNEQEHGRSPQRVLTHFNRSWTTTSYRSRVSCAYAAPE